MDGGALEGGGNGLGCVVQCAKDEGWYGEDGLTGLGEGGGV